MTTFQVKRADFQEVKGFPLEDRVIDFWEMRERFPTAAFWARPDFIEKKTGKFIQVKGVNSSFSACGIKDDLQKAVLAYLNKDVANYYIFDVSSVKGKGLVKRHVLISKKDLKEIVKDGYTTDLFRWVDRSKLRIRPQIGPNKRVLLLRYNAEIFEA